MHHFSCSLYTLLVAAGFSSMPVRVCKLSPHKRMLLTGGNQKKALAGSRWTWDSMGRLCGNPSNCVSESAEILNEQFTVCRHTNRRICVDVRHRSICVDIPIEKVRQRERERERDPFRFVSLHRCADSYVSKDAPTQREQTEVSAILRCHGR